MKKLISFCVLLFPLLLTAQEPDTTSALSGMLKAERSFARHSAMHGRRDAFAEFLAEFSMIYTNEWIMNGREYWNKRSPSPVILKWEPEYMDISTSRDFGVSLGPWEAQEYRPGTKPLGTGYFLSVWTKQKDGKWKVQLDAGINSPPMSEKDKHSFYFPAGADKPGPAFDTIDYTAVYLMDAESEMLDSWRKDPSFSTYIAFFEKSSRFMRNGHLPSENPDSLKKWMDETGKSLSWEAQGSSVSNSNDMAFTYGLLTYEGKKGHFVRIWRKNAGGKWKISIEMMNY